jgi:hypothetical protein
MTNAPVQIPEQQVERVQGIFYGAFTTALLAAAGFLTFAQFAAL